MIGPKTPEEIVAAGHAGGFSLFCDCSELWWDQQGKTKDEMERLEGISETWSRLKRCVVFVFLSC